MSRPYHISVLVAEVLQYLDPQPHKIYVDATFGGGGHTRAILSKEPTCRVIAIDWDRHAIDTHEEQFKAEFGDRLTIIWGNFAQLSLLLKKQNITKVDGILADFGTSQHHIFAGRGFSFLDDSPLDMRMSPAHHQITAAHILNRASEQELVHIFKEYSQEPHARLIARTIIAQRDKTPFKTTGQLAKLIEQIVPRHGSHIHPATRVFQALRIAVNHELEAIRGFLHQVPLVLNNNGRLVCISFHALEDGLVKNFLREHRAHTNNLGFVSLTDGPVQAGEQERDDNPSARSAKLRAAIFQL